MLPLKHYGIILAMIFALFTNQEALADNIVTDVYDKSKKAIEEYRVRLHSWDSLIRGYRRGHNYSLSACTSNTTWKSSIFAEDLDTMEGCINFSYGYHVKLYNIFGYMLGTNAEYSIVSEQEDDPIVSDPTVYQLPGVTGGLIFYFSPGFRVLLQSTYTLQRIEQLAVDIDNNIDTYNITLEVIEYGVVTDFFVSMHTGLRFFYKEKIRSNSSSFNMVGNSNSFGLGIVYHVL